jgi:type I restriction enzyme, S subunit
MSKQYEEYKDSGLEWLGEIPAHWEVSKLKYEAESVLGKMLTPEDKGGYFLKPYLKSKNIGWGKLNLKSVDEMWFSEKELENYRVKKDDLLVSEGGEIGKTSMWDNELEECYIQNSVHKVTVYPKNHARYFFYYFHYLGKIGYFWNVVSQVSIAHLTKEKLVKSPCLVPPYEEQEAIAKLLDTRTNEIDKALDKIKKQVAKLNSYRQSIINEVVTGKVDVRDVVLSEV